MSASISSFAFNAGGIRARRRTKTFGNDQRPEESRRREFVLQFVRARDVQVHRTQVIRNFRVSHGTHVRCSAHRGQIEPMGTLPDLSSNPPSRVRRAHLYDPQIQCLARAVNRKEGLVSYLISGRVRVWPSGSACAHKFKDVCRPRFQSSGTLLGEVVPSDRRPPPLEVSPAGGQEACPRRPNRRRGARGWRRRFA